jgi:hypothetical protein
LLNITPPAHLEKTDAEPEPESESLPTVPEKGAVNYDDAKVIKKPDVVPNTPEESEESDVETPPGEQLVIKPVVDDTEIFKDAPVKKTRKRKPPSEKQLAHLAKARAKAQEMKKARDLLKAGQTEKKAVKAKDTRPQADEKESLVLHLSRDELKKYTEDAIEGYDTKRKARKAVKKQAQEEYAKANKVNRTIARAIGQPDPDDMWSVCFQ